MSNYNYERFPGYEENFIAGPEVVNGTGQVSLKFLQDGSDEVAESVLLLMPADDVLDLAKWLSRLAFEALRVKWQEDHLNVG